MKLQSLAKNHLFIFVVALIIRLATFQLYINHDERYKQPDSMDYHNCTLGMVLGTGMHRADTKEPIFWRTPGYPAYLSFFYSCYPLTSAAFPASSKAHYAALMVQIFLCSFIPLIIFYLARIMTQSYQLALTAAWIAVIHPGLILSSTFLLTEGLAMILFYLFLYCIYKQLHRAQKWYLLLFFAALTLGLMTWIRPMGELVAIITCILIMLFDQTTLKTRAKKSILFFTIFALSISGWYVRNYNLSKQLFFCPIIGAYLNSFVTPRIIRDVYNIPLEKSTSIMYKQAMKELEKDQKQSTDPNIKIVKERVCARVVWPIITAYPWHVLYYWIKEVLKTTFDLYSYQLVAIANNTFQYDPLEEFLFEKIADSLYKKPVPVWIRIICWLELIYAILLWIGIAGGLFYFILRPLFEYKNVTQFEKNRLTLWIFTLLLIGGILSMTGGYGYARLRLPVEPLLLILALTFWAFILNKKQIPDCTLNVAD